MAKTKITWHNSPPDEMPAAEKPPVADHIICMTCGAHIEPGMMNRHYYSLHPDTLRRPEEETRETD